MKTKEEILEYIKGKRFYCANKAERLSLINFFIKNEIPVHYLILRHLNDETTYSTFLWSGGSIGANFGKDDDSLDYFEYSKVCDIKKYKEPKWKKIWRN